MRQRASVMDVSTLGKYRIAGRDAAEFLERLYPCHVRTIAPGRSRYALLLNEAGYVFDDGLICSLGPDGYYVTVTSGGADQAEGWFRDWADAWSMQVHIANLTGTLGAINVAGPKAREVLAALTTDPVDNAAIPYNQHREVTIAGVRCRVLRVGFVGELSYELHHPRLESGALWDALLDAGKFSTCAARPRGAAAAPAREGPHHRRPGHRVRLDTGETRARLGREMDKPYFVGRTALERLGQLERDLALVSYTFTGRALPPTAPRSWSTARDRLPHLLPLFPGPGPWHRARLCETDNGGVPATITAVDGSGQFRGPGAGCVLRPGRDPAPVLELARPTRVVVCSTRPPPFSTRLPPRRSTSWRGWRETSSG